MRRKSFILWILLTTASLIVILIFFKNLETRVKEREEEVARVENFLKTQSGLQHVRVSSVLGKGYFITGNCATNDDFIKLKQFIEFNKINMTLKVDPIPSEQPSNLRK